MQTDVLVVGAGPTGLMLATELGLAGVVPVIIDALPTPSGPAKSAAVQPRTAEVFDLRGLMDRLLEMTPPGEPISGHFGGLPVALDCRPWHTRHPYPVPTPQSCIDQLLVQRLAEFDISVRRGHQLTALHPDDDGVTADDDGVTATVHDQVTGANLKIRARYLVACDGGHSTVRKLREVPFPGHAGTRLAVLAEVRLTAKSDLVPTSISQFNAMVRDGGGYWSMLNPIDGDLYRLVFGSVEETTDNQRRDSPVDADDVRHALQAVWGSGTQLGQINWLPGSATPPGKSSITASGACSSQVTPSTSTHRWAVKVSISVSRTHSTSVGSSLLTSRAGPPPDCSTAITLNVTPWPPASCTTLGPSACWPTAAPPTMLPPCVTSSPTSRAFPTPTDTSQA